MEVGSEVWRRWMWGWGWDMGMEDKGGLRWR